MSSTPRRFMLCNGKCVTAEHLPAYPDSHIIGELRYVSDEGRKVSALALYRDSRSVNDVPAEMPPLRIEAIIGDARGIECTRCAKTRVRWEVGKAAMQALVEKVLKLRKMGEE